MPATIAGRGINEISKDADLGNNHSDGSTIQLAAGSIWDASLFLGTAGLGLGCSTFGAFVLVWNAAIQSFFCPHGPRKSDPGELHSGHNERVPYMERKHRTSFSVCRFCNKRASRCGGLLGRSGRNKRGTGSDTFDNCICWSNASVLYMPVHMGCSQIIWRSRGSGSQLPAVVCGL